MNEAELPLLSGCPLGVQDAISYTAAIAACEPVGRWQMMLDTGMGSLRDCGGSSEESMLASCCSQNGITIFSGVSEFS